MKYVIGAILAIGALIAAWYYLIYKPSKDKQSSSGGNNGGVSDPCANVVCKNGGKCSNGVCRCSGGWTGADCGTQTINQGTASLNLAVGSIQVNMKDVSSAPSPSTFYSNVEGDLTSYNILSAEIPTVPLIHFSVGNTSCSQHIWYNHSLYSKRGEITNPSTGVKTCYYGIDAQSFPSEIAMKCPLCFGDCSRYKSMYIISGIRYVYNRNKLVSGGLIHNPYTVCIFTKQ